MKSTSASAPNAAAHERVQFVKGALAMVDMLADDSDAKKHRDLRRTEIERSEANVVKVAEAIVGFIINSFEMEQRDLQYLHVI
jgi:predicted Holliday junction resolvase-like endonuclease